MHPLRIAVIGSGISGASAAWLLSKTHDVTLYEANDRPGGHTNTVVMDVDGTPVPVDTGFICYNSVSYPNLVALFDHLDVPSHDTTMSFAASLDGGSYEYSGGTYFGILAQPSNALRPSHWRMVRDILRFFREAPQDAPALADDVTLAQYLAAKDYSAAFIDRHLLPMAAAIWSSRTGDMTSYPAKAFIRFFANHGLLQVEGRPKWSTVLGGSKVYHERLLADGDMQVRTGEAVRSIKRDAGGATVDGVRYDHVVVATHADEALAMLADPSALETDLLGTFSYSNNTAVLHRDARLMPKRKLAWASWNYVEPSGAAEPALTYWMNSLQKLPTKEDIFVSLNPPTDMKLKGEAGRFDYQHPIFDSAALEAQRNLWSLQGTNRTWFCGAHFGAGFHEDGLQSGLAVAEQLGGTRRPWTVANESGRIHVQDTTSLAQAAE